jgi:FkbM family methyltransferase
MKNYYLKLRRFLNKLAKKTGFTKMRNMPREGWLETEWEGNKWRLNLSQEIDRLIAERSYEIDTTDLIRKIVKPGMKVLDIGANIGYYTTVMGKLVGETGEVWAFEPVERYRQQNQWHVRENRLQNRVHLLDFALSDHKGTAEITIDKVSATMHHVPYDVRYQLENEIIRLDMLDNVSRELSLPKIDFIKMDTDGHEPFVLKGAKQFFKRHRPVMVIEFAQLWLDKANSDVRELKDMFDAYDYALFSQFSFRPFETRQAFLFECGNFNKPVNVWAVPKDTIKLLSDLF